MVGREKRDTWWLPTAQHISIKAHILKSIDDRREKKEIWWVYLCTASHMEQFNENSLSKAQI